VKDRAVRLARVDRSGRRRRGLAVAIAAALLAGAHAGGATADDLVFVSVVRVVDGDSLVTALGARRIEVRLADVDAPEWRQPAGRAARELAESLVAGKEVRLRPRARDGHGRLVADVYLADGRSVAHLLVASGLAWHDGRFRPNPGLASLEESARRARIGLWSAPRPEPPWDYRKRTPRRGRRR
jgi:endonuclease YncB( thermonuclease family)